MYLAYCYPRKGSKRPIKHRANSFKAAEKVAERLAGPPTYRECEVLKIMRRCG